MKQMTWDDEVTFLGVAGFKEDALGQQIPVQAETTVYCTRRPVSRQEFYLAGQNDIQISEILVVHPYEYNGENMILFHGKKLRIVKTYEISMEELELTCTERLGDKDGGAPKTGNKS